MDLSETDTRLARLKWRRAFDQLENKLALWVESVKTGFDPNQPRVPAGNSDGGQWASGGGNGTGSRTDRNNSTGSTPRDFRNPDKPRVQLAQMRRTRRSIQIGNRRFPATTSQAMRYGTADRRAKKLLERVQELDPAWKPRPNAAPPQTAEGAINTRRGEARDAEVRLRELATQGLGPGPFAKESISARGQGRSFRVDERQEMNKLGYRDGCHTC